MERQVSQMNEFKRFHPAVNFTYFLFIIGFSMFYMHPVSLIISFVSGLTYSVMLGGRKAIRFNICFMLPLMLFSALINTLFNHQGITVLAYFPNGNPMTLQSLLYGFAAAVMIGAVICHFSCYNSIMTSDKFIYLFGRIIPSLSLIFSMVLRFVPRFKNQLKAVSAGQKCIGNDISQGGVIKRAKSGLRILSGVISWALENSIETADSMKSRGYGLAGRTAFSNFSFDKRDLKTLIFMVVSGIYVIIGGSKIDYGYFPEITTSGVTPYTASVFVVYFMLCIMPVAIECMEERKWILLKRKI